MSAAHDWWTPLKNAVYSGAMSGLRPATHALLTKLLCTSHQSDAVTPLPYDATLEGALRKFYPSATRADVRHAVRELTDPDDPIVCFEGTPFNRTARIVAPLRWLGHQAPAVPESRPTPANVQRTDTQTGAERAKAYRERRRQAASGPVTPNVTRNVTPVTPVTENVTPVTPTVTIVTRSEDQRSEIRDLKQKIPPSPVTAVTRDVTPVTPPVTPPVTEAVTPPVTLGGDSSTSSEDSQSETRMRAARPAREPIGTAPPSDGVVFVDAVRKSTRNPAWTYRAHFPSNAQALRELTAVMDADGYDDPTVRRDRIEALVGFFVEWAKANGREPEPDTFKTWLAKHPHFRAKKPKAKPPGPPPEPPRLSKEERKNAIGSLAEALGVGPGLAQARAFPLEPERLAAAE